MSIRKLGKAMTKKLKGSGNPSGITGWTIFGGVVSTASGISAYNQSRAQGNGVIGSAAHGLSEAFMAELVGPLYFPAMAAVAAPKYAVRGYESMMRKAREMERVGAAPFTGNTFVDTEQTYTMRQAGMQMIQGSILNTKKALLGNEAQYLHR
jgi:hypothetical protein